MTIIAGKGEKGSFESAARIGIVLFLLFFLFELPLGFSAASISPYKGTFNITFGRTLEIPILIANLDDEAGVFTLKTGGTVAPFSTLSETNITVPARSRKTVKLSINVPKTANLTEYYAEVILRKATSANASSGSGGVTFTSSLSGIYKLVPTSPPRPTFSFSAISPTFFITGAVIAVGFAVAFVLFRVLSGR